MSSVYDDHDPSTDNYASSGHAVDVIELWERLWVHENVLISRTLGARRVPTPHTATSTATRAPSRRPNSRPRPKDPPAPTEISAQEPPPPAHDVSGDIRQNQNNHNSTAAEREDVRVAAILQKLPGIGTWAGRQQLFTLRRPSPNALDSQHQRPPLESTEVEVGSADEELEDMAADRQDTSFPCSNSSNTNINSSGITAAAEGSNDTFLGETIIDTPLALASSEDCANEAWRWRFSRKWQQEQLRGAFNDGGVGDDGVEEIDALEYCQACGVGIGLQVQAPPPSYHHRNRHHRHHRRRCSRESKTVPFAALCRRSATSALAMAATGSHQSLLYSSASDAATCQFDVEASYASSRRGGIGGIGSRDDGADGCLAAEDDDTSTGGSLPPSRSPSGTLSVAASVPTTSTTAYAAPFASSYSRTCAAPATREMLLVAGRAKELLRCQSEIESAASAQWQRSACTGSPWAGTVLPPCEIDMYGNFLYLVLRVKEGGGGTRHRMLLRGRRGACRETLLTEAASAAVSVSVRHGFPRPEMEVVGTGQMEWRADTERHLVLLPAPLLHAHRHGGTAGVAGHLAAPARRMVHKVAPGAGGASSPPSDGELEDVSGLAASLVRQALPCHFGISCHRCYGISPTTPSTAAAVAGYV